MYLRCNEGTTFELEEGDVAVKNVPEHYLPILKEHKEEIFNLLKDWKKMYVDRLKEIQVEATKEYDASFEGKENSWEENCSSWYSSFIHLEKHLLDGYDYGQSCIWDKGICPEVVMCCHYCATSGNWRNNADN
jgi:hypothetical protein